jgi:hypothetical protein
MTALEVGTSVAAIRGPGAVTPVLALSLCQVSTHSSRNERRTPHPHPSTKGHRR